MKAIAFSVLFIGLTFQAQALRSASLGAANKDKQKAQELFLAGSTAIAQGRYDQGRIPLLTLIYTYTDSPLVDQAKLLVFYSAAKQDASHHESSAKLLREL